MVSYLVFVFVHTCSHTPYFSYFHVASFALFEDEHEIWHYSECVFVCLKATFKFKVLAKLANCLKALYSSIIKEPYTVCQCKNFLCMWNVVSTWRN